MTNRQGRHRSAPVLHLLIMLVKIGFGAVFWAVLILTVIAWPMQSVLVYTALVAWPESLPPSKRGSATARITGQTVPATSGW